MKIKIFTATTCAALLDFKTNSEIKNLYNDSDEFRYGDAEYLSDKLDLELESPKLDNSPSNDLENSIKIFEALKQLDLVQANDKRLWVSIAHTILYQYSIKRWKINADTSDDVIMDRLHFEGTAIRQRNQHSIARLWWGARLTYDENRTDPYELTKILWEKQDFYQNLIDRRYSAYKNVLHAFLEFYSKNRHLDLKKDMRKVFKGINALGGVRVLPLLEQSEIQEHMKKISRFYGLTVNAS